MTVDFDTKVSGWSWGSRWVISVTEAPNGGSVVSARMARAGSVLASTTEGKKIYAIYEFAEAQLPKSNTSSKSPLADSSAFTSSELHVAVVPPPSAAKFGQVVRDSLAALAEAELASTNDDAVAEELAIFRAARVAYSTGALSFAPKTWFNDELQARVSARRLRKEVELIGAVGRGLIVMSDRILQNDTVHLLDKAVRASVEIDGQLIASSRPTLTRMAVGSVLPGSALLVGLAVPKTTSADTRRASFVLAHPRWRLIEPIDPDGAHEVAAIAAQVNAVASELGQFATTDEPAESPTDLVMQLERLAALHASGVLTTEEFRAAKSKLLS